MKETNDVTERLRSEIGNSPVGTEEVWLEIEHRAGEPDHRDAHHSSSRRVGLAAAALLLVAGTVAWVATSSAREDPEPLETVALNETEEPIEQTPRSETSMQHTPSTHSTTPETSENQVMPEPDCGLRPGTPEVTELVQSGYEAAKILLPELGIPFFSVGGEYDEESCRISLQIQAVPHERQFEVVYKLAEQLGDGYRIHATESKVGSWEPTQTSLD